MTSPKEALVKGQDFLSEQDLVATFADPDPTGLRETIEIIQAAIPVAELQEALWQFVFTPSGVDIDDKDYDMDQFWPEIIRLRKEMEALK